MVSTFINKSELISIDATDFLVGKVDTGNIDQILLAGAMSSHVLPVKMFTGLGY